MFDSDLDGNEGTAPHKHKAGKPKPIGSCALFVFHDFTKIGCSRPIDVKEIVEILGLNIEVKRLLTKRRNNGQ